MDEDKFLRVEGNNKLALMAIQVFGPIFTKNGEGGHVFTLAGRKMCGAQDPIGGAIPALKSIECLA